MKTAYQVKVAYSGASKQADNIEKIATKIDKKRQALAEERSRLARHWTGDNSNTYQGKMGQREQELSRIVTDLKNVADTIRQVSKNSYDADMRAIQIAQKNAAKKKNK
jgi:WXG100 family type VII secretion target